MREEVKKKKMNFLLGKVFAAETPVPIEATGDFAKLGDISVASLVGGLINLALVVAALVFFFILVLGGIKWITSQGEEGKVKEAREQVTQALIGLVIVFVAFAVAKLIESVFGVNIQELKIPTFLEQ
jgi:cytochrome bd-type quinol oxidase subunit 2